MQQLIYLISTILNCAIADIPNPWKITVCGKIFENIQNNEDYVRKLCSPGEFCVPITHSLSYCNNIDNLTTDKQIRRNLREKNCGFVHGVPMLCYPSDQVNPNPECDIGNSFCNISDEKTIAPRNPTSNSIPCGSRSPTSDEPRISGGQNVYPGKYPWMAGLFNKDRTMICGGSLITNRHILTAAHCVFNQDLDDIEVRLGDTNLKTEFDCYRYDVEDCTDSRSCFDAGKCAEPHLLRRIKGVNINPNYKQSRKIEENTNDLAVVKLDRPVFRTDTVLPVCLPEPSQIKNLIDPSPNNLFFVAGWGRISNFDVATILQDLQVSVVPQNECGIRWSFKVDKSFLCVNRFDGAGSVCQGDSGGPLVTVSPAGEFIQIGVVSAGDQICGPRGKPTLFTILNEDRLAWVQSVIDN